MKKLIYAMFLVVSVHVIAQSNVVDTQFTTQLIKVSDKIYSGARPSQGDLVKLQALGVKTDISLQGGDLNNKDLRDIMAWLEPGETPENIAAEKALATQLNIGFVNLPLSSLNAVTPDEAALIDQALEIMNQSPQPVYIHCEHGVDRTGLVVALYRVKYQNWCAERAHKEWADNGHRGVSLYFTGKLDTYFYQRAEDWIGAKGCVN
jgi:protein tyrosine/serine phosphatase